ncbi:MAG: histidine phosphatase family protein [Acidimicrobiales bacterium]|nr:histidine phosphatase family protein [Acidimicrobiales bacterium]|tara:strand:+ start:16495 stop:17073 length:579 start_codon:yes stop_codon:yes gene_type:complete
MTKLLIVRHGQSEWNALGRWQGQADPPLTDVGENQAKKATKKLGLFDSIVSSPLQRAKNTASIISEITGVGPVTTEVGLMERDAGPWQGLTRIEIEKGWPGFLDSGHRPDGYESNPDLLSRIFEVLKKISKNSDSILIVSHAGIVHALENLHNQPSKKVPNLGGRWFEFVDDELIMGKRALLITEDPTPDLL